ncbi:zinc phosphodiesterase ELAC protein 2-like [Varroa destructor]|uniref:ribonuclease Z n=1 Tax=Varroa destructor TaxID=109461 RepID=A0A7M7M603_VARDE|nr:zinc phosphodiesterase ELAC protein 2-like [Varroa destructor]XP_022651972.1 zinc phosphodiesterase ELAC protein 2-like [Varroa destructor]XP_022651973.1 zinc phosphodiesterase ELAC protein 2-like [Varroa destructor]
MILTLTQTKASMLRLWIRNWSIHRGLTKNRSISSTVNDGTGPFQNRDHAKQIKRQQMLKRIEGAQRQSSNVITLRVFGNGCVGGPRSVSVVVGNSRYLFNCGEGTQKLCQEYGVKMSDVRTLFFTSPTWENIGGILGYMLTVQSCGMHEFEICGHSDIMKIFEITEPFANFNGIKLTRHNKLDFSDSLISIQSVIFNKSNSCDTSDSIINENEVSEDIIPNDAVIGYICKPYKQPKKLNLYRCVELRVPPGPPFMKIKAGEEVVLDDGRVIKPDDVFCLDSCAAVFIILECPAEEYIDSFLKAKEFSPYQLGENAAQYDDTGVIVHMTPKKIFDSPKYQMFCKKFRSNIVHLPLCEENTYELSAKSCSAQYKLSLIHDEIFPPPSRSSNVGVAAFTKYHIRPHLGLDDKAAVKIKPEQYISEARSVPNFELALKQVNDQLSKLKIVDKREYPLVVFLGTGSAVPNNDRNVSGILVVTGPETYLLLDCGESTYSQLIRHYGINRSKEILRNLQCVYVSHMHADHHLGLITMINERTKLGVETTLRVIGPISLLQWLQKYGELFGQLKFDFVNSATFQGKATEGFPPANIPSHQDLLANLGIKRIATCEVDHCPDAYGVRIDIGSGYSLVYSGDTRRCPSLIELGQGCDLLIHEATLETGFEDEALVKGHCTTAQAVEVGRQMNAKFTLLTHFSQRYVKIPNEDESIFAEEGVGFAFDHMQISPKLLQILPHLYPAIRCLFSQYVEKMKQRTISASKMDWVRTELKEFNKNGNKVRAPEDCLKNHSKAIEVS